MPTQTPGQEIIAKLRAIVSAAAVACLVLLAHGSDWLRPLQYFLEDLRFITSPRPATDSLVVVQIDPASISHIGPWPWRRGVHADVIDRLVALGARDIAIDVDFSSPSEPQEDDKLAAALSRAGGSVILPAFKQAAHGGDGTNLTVANLPIASLASESWTASVNVLADADGKVRRIAASNSVAGQIMPALAAMLAGSAFRERTFRLDYGIDPATIDRISVADLLQHKIPPSRIANKKIVIGATAIELRDYVLVPVHGFISGPVFHALATETLLQGRSLHTPASNVMVVWLTLTVLFSGWLLARNSWLWTLSFVSAGAASIEVFAHIAYTAHALLIDTSAVQSLLAAIAIVALLQEIDLGTIKLWLARTEARNLRAVLSQVITDNFDGIIVSDEHGIIEASSAQAAAILNLPHRALTAGKRIDDSLPSELSKALADAIAHLRSDGLSNRRPAECLLNVAGSVRILEYVVTPSRIERKGAVWGRKLVNRDVICLTFRDITEQRRLEQETFRLARYSQLTGLPNRHALHDKLAELQQTSDERSPLAVMVLDIDRFRSINRTLGYHYGDTLLRAVAFRLTSLSGEVKFAAHLGGDDFAVLIGGWATREELSEIVDLLVFAMNQPYTIDMRQLHISFSAGIFICAPRAQNPIDAVMMADNALLASKQSGGSAPAFHEEAITTEVAHRQALEIDLWQAFDKGQFSILYQPQVDLMTNQVIGAEALLRWNHPSRGPISPVEFIPLTEVTGMILPLGRWVLEKACQDAAAWPTDCKVAVNVSVWQLSRTDMVDEIENALVQSGLAAERLELEVTEGLFMHDAPRAIEALRKLQSKGIHLSIDDFGTGYSSLSYLSSFPFNKLKIDKSFVADLDTKTTAKAIVKTIISLAQRVKVSVIAEGIETQEQSRLLQALGCREGQGFYFGRPLETHEFARMLLNRRAAGGRDRRATAAAFRTPAPETVSVLY